MPTYLPTYLPGNPDNEGETRCRLVTRLVFACAGIRIGINHGLKLHPGVRIGTDSAEPKSESESILPMNDRFRPTIIQSGLFAPNTLERCVSYTYWRFYSYACCQKSHLFRILMFFFFRSGGVMDPRPMESKWSRFRIRKSEVVINLF